MSGPAKIRVEIDEVVLHGFDPRDRHSIGDAVQSELARLLTAAAPDLAAAGDRQRIDAGRFDAAGAGPAAIGRGAAGALYRSLG